jgi:hypothetical protein
MGIFASGMSDSGWAWSLAGKRYAQEGYFDGTMMGILFSWVRKKLSDSHSLNFTGFIPQIVEGRIAKYRWGNKN